jgi:hypothetical protein
MKRRLASLSIPASRRPMKFVLPLLLLSPCLLASCGPNRIVEDVYSPSMHYHVEVRQCPEVGSLAGGVETQASILEAKNAGICHSSENAIAQFSVNAPENQLELEWISDTRLRAWHPAFNPKYGPEVFSHAPNSPIKVQFAPKKGF